MDFPCWPVPVRLKIAFDGTILVVFGMNTVRICIPRRLRLRIYRLFRLGNLSSCLLEKSMHDVKYRVPKESVAVTLREHVPTSETCMVTSTGEGPGQRTSMSTTSPNIPYSIMIFQPWSHASCLSLNNVQSNRIGSL